MDITDSDKRARVQSVDDWVSEYSTGIRVIPNSRDREPYSNPEVILRFDHHRTTKDGKLVLSFVNIQIPQEIVCFFNVDVRRQRGSNKGKSYRTGENGQFLAPKRGKFREFWMKVVGKPPCRWASVHKQLKTKLKNRLFTGRTEVRYRCDGSPFNMVSEVIELSEQNLHNYGTEAEQQRNNNWEQSVSGSSVIQGYTAHFDRTAS